MRAQLILTRHTDKHNPLAPQKHATHQMNGETKLSTWKLFSRVFSISSPVWVIPMTRRTNAVSSRQSVLSETAFQKLKARQVTKRMSW